jgi:parallel beta-helix repeat protein
MIFLFLAAHCYSHLDRPDWSLKRARLSEKSQRNWSLFLMKPILGLIAFVWACSLCSLAQTTCTQAPQGYYVSTTGSDSNTGTACSPWRTLQHAANMAGAGATVHVLPGTYTQDLLTLNNSGTAAARIRFISDQKWGAKIRSTSSYTVLRMNGSYLDILGFDLAGDSNSCLGMADWGSNNRIISNHVHNIPARLAVCGNNGGAGIYHANASGTNDDTIGNTVHDIGSWPTLDSNVHGITHSNVGGHVWNNVVYRCAGFGLQFFHGASAVTVANNTVFNNVFGGVYVDGTSNMLVTNNIVVNNTQWGIVEESGTIGTNDRYLNNLVYNNARGNITLQFPSVQSGTIVADPQFVNYTGGVDGSYSLKSTSPARDHGTSTGAPTYDADGGPRPINAAWDLGEFEYGTTPKVWPWFPGSTSITVTISPTSATLQVGTSKQFTATVSGTSNTGVTWLVNGVSGGNSTAGTISSSGLYTAPSSVPSGGSVTVAATSVANSASSAKATVTISASAPAPSPTPTPAPSPTPTPTTGGFYVSPTGSDSNSGTAAAPWATIQHAAAMVKPGSIVHVEPGTYGVVNSTISGSSTARIRFVSDVKWGAKIVGSGTDTAWTNSGNYVDIVGFDISGNVRIGVLNNASFVRTIGNNVHNIAGSCSSNGGAGIDNASFTGTDNDIIGNVVHDVGNPTVQCYTVQGIYHSNLRGHILNNISYRNAAWGIQLWHAANNVVISNNLVFQNGEGGIVVGDGDAPGGVTDDNTLVSNNIVMDNRSSWGAGLAIYEAGPTGTGNRYLNNLIWNNTQGIVLQNGLHDVNTINADPLLVNYQPAGGGDYHLTSSSRAINSGTTTGMPPKDFDGAPRPFGTGPDIGPYEYGSTPTAWPWM